MFKNQAVIQPTNLPRIFSHFFKNSIRIFFLLFCLAAFLFEARAQVSADFSVNKSSGCSPLLVSFTGPSSEGASYSWNFGNGNTSNLPNPAASFIQAGTYTIKLTVKGANGQTASSEKQITVFSNPLADFASDRVKACVNDSIIFSDRSTNGSNPVTSWSWDFGDGSSSADRVPAPVKYSFSDQFKITLVVKDDNGCQSSVTKNNYISISDIKAGFTASSTISCKAPLTVSFRDTTRTQGDTYTRAWDFGDGSTAVGETPSHTYTAKGTFPVRLTITNTSGCVRSVIKEKLVSIQQPIAGFTAVNTNGCAPLKVSLVNQSQAADTSIITYSWSSSAGHTSSAKHPEFTFTTPGKHSITLRISIPGSCSDSLVRTDYIHVYPKAVAKVTLSANKFCKLPAVVSVYTQAEAGSQVAGLLWGDNTGVNQAPEKTYNSFGQFSIKVIAQNDMGCKDTIAASQVVDITPPYFAISISKKNGCAPFASTLKATTGNGLNKWEWSINGRQVSSLQEANVNIADTGIHIITCTGSNADGCSVTITDTIVAGAKITPAFSSDKQQTCYRNNSFLFTNLTDPASQVRPDKWSWDFGDNTYSSSDAPAHTYGKTGTFQVKLTAIHKGCSTETSPVTLTVNGPKAAFTVPALSCSNDSITFTDLSVGVHTRQWNFGDGHFSDQQKAKHKYTPGTYPVSLIVSDTVNGCIDSLNNAIIVPVIETPSIRFTISDTVVCPSEQISFTDLTSGDISRSVWIFGTVKSVQGKQAVFSTSTKGYYALTLIVTTSNGCHYTLIKDSAFRVLGETIDLRVANNAGCLPLTVKATDHTITEFPVTSRTWQWGNGESSAENSASAEYTYTAIPQDQYKGYNATLRLTDAMGCTYTASQPVKPTRPSARFSHKINKGCGQDSVKFTALPLSKGVSPFTFKWSFDNDSSSLPNPQQIFSGNSRSAVAVKLIVADSNNCVDSISETLQIDTRTPLALFSATPEKILACPGPPVYFRDNSVAGASAIKSWEWSFGDQTRSIMKSPAKTYLEPGRYDVSLTITDSLGCVASVHKSEYIKIAGPLATYKITSKAGCLPLAVSFEAVSSNTQKFEWDMGDGTVDTNATYQHTYTKHGSYFPNLVITDSAGCSRTLPVTDTIQVYSLPVPELETNKNKICKGSSVVFNNTTRHDKKIGTCQWNFGDGNNTSSEGLHSLQHKYTDAGAFTVRLKVTDELGCSDSISKPSLVQVFYDSIAPAVPSVIHATVLDNESTHFVFRKNEETDFEHYTVFYKYASSGQADSATWFPVNDTLFTERGLYTPDHRYFYSVSATDACHNESARSPLHATIQLSAQAAVNAVQLNWTSYKGWKPQRYEIHRYDVASAVYEKIATVNGNTTLYTDSFPACHKVHYYKVKAIENDEAGSYSWSDSSGAKPVFRSTLPVTAHVRATVEENAWTRLEWKNSTHRYPYHVLLYRAINNSEPAFYKQLDATDTVFIDKDVNVHNAAYTYITYLEDECGAKSEASKPSRTLLLNMELQQTGKPGYNPELKWNSYMQWDAGVEDYQVEFKYDSLDHFSVKHTTNAFEFFDKEIDAQQRNYCYQVVARQKGNTDIRSRSNMVCTSTDPKLFAPNAFTPNSDGINETFRVHGVFIEEFNLKIWNRYGELVFESNDMQQGWDAQYRNEAAPSDAYVYLAEAKGRSGKLATITGTVTLMR